MMMHYLLDTNTCIDLLRGVEAVVASAEAVSPDDCAISTVTTYELFAGVAKCRRPDSERRKVEALIGTLHELPFHRPAAERAARLRADLEKRGHMIGPYDIQIAAQALAENLILVTSNQGEFKRVDGIQLVDWRQ